MATANELAGLYDQLMVGCVQLTRFHEMTRDAASALDREASVPDTALAALEEYLDRSRDPTLTLQVEDSGETLTLTREEAAYLHRLTTMGLEIEVRYPRLANNMILIYLTTLFEAFVLDSVRVVITGVARDLRRGQGRDAVNGLLVRLLRRQVTDLGFRSIQVKLRFVEDTLGVDPRGYPETPADLEELYATRNLLVHNGGVVNRKYLSLVRGSRLRVGETRPVDDEYVHAAIATVQGVGEYLYRSLVSRYTDEDPEERLRQAARLTERLSGLLGGQEGA